MCMDAPPPLVLVPVLLPLGLEDPVEQCAGESVDPRSEEKFHDMRVVDDGAPAPCWAVLVTRRHQPVQIRPVVVGG